MQHYKLGASLRHTRFARARTIEHCTHTSTTHAMDKQALHAHRLRFHMCLHEAGVNIEFLFEHIRNERARAQCATAHRDLVIRMTCSERMRQSHSSALQPTIIWCCPLAIRSSGTRYCEWEGLAAHNPNRLQLWNQVLHARWDMCCK